MIELPDPRIEQVRMLQGILIATARGGTRNDATYRYLRRELMTDDQIKRLLPGFVRIHQDLDAFWPFIKHEAPSYEEREAIIRKAFTPLLGRLEGLEEVPSDPVTSDGLEAFDVDSVHAVWSKALSRRTEDPEGAITLARTLLETVIKRILDTAVP